MGLRGFGFSGSGVFSLLPSKDEACSKVLGFEGLGAALALGAPQGSGPEGLPGFFTLTLARARQGST